MKAAKLLNVSRGRPRYRAQKYTGFIVSLTLNNALNNLHQEFLGAPFMGRVGMLKVQYDF